MLTRRRKCEIVIIGFDVNLKWLRWEDREKPCFLDEIPDVQPKNDLCISFFSNPGKASRPYSGWPWDHMSWIDLADRKKKWSHVYRTTFATILSVLKLYVINSWNRQQTLSAPKLTVPVVVVLQLAPSALQFIWYYQLWNLASSAEKQKLRE